METLLNPLHLLSGLADVLYIGLAFSVILLIVLENRSPVRTIAWIMVLIFLPVVGLILYFLFGRNTRKLRIISKRGMRQLNTRIIEAWQSGTLNPIDERWSRLSGFFQSVNASYPLSTSDIRLYISGYDFIHSLLQDFSHAEHHIHIESYIIGDDAVGRLIRDSLIDCARRGVRVRVIYDDVGSWRTPNSFFEEMRFAGIEVEGFLKVRFPIFTGKVNYRNHRKICIIDGEIGYIGGMNIAERYLKGNKSGIWRDSHVRIAGQSVYSLQARFFLDWYFINRTQLHLNDAYFPPKASTSGIPTQIVTSSPVDPWRDMLQGFLLLIGQVHRYIYIQTPYLLPNQQLLLALQTAALAGIDVRIMIPSKNDSMLIQKASMSYFDDLLASGVKIYLYSPGFLHSKLIVADDYVTSIGSTNMDFRSFEHNFESNAFFYDTTLAISTKKIFLDAQKDSTQLQANIWKLRHWKDRLAESILRLFAPLL